MKRKVHVRKAKMLLGKKLIEWKNEIIEANSKNTFLKWIAKYHSPDIVDQASSQTEKTVEMRTLNRQKLLERLIKL